MADDEADGSGEDQEPFKLTDLPEEDQSLTGWRMVKRIHEAAVEAEKDTYIDPASTYSVFTSRCALYFYPPFGLKSALSGREALSNIECMSADVSSQIKRLPGIVVSVLKEEAFRRDMYL